MKMKPPHLKWSKKYIGGFPPIPGVEDVWQPGYIMSCWPKTTGVGLFGGFKLACDTKTCEACGHVELTASRMIKT